MDSFENEDDPEITNLISEKISGFISELSDEYLTESWKKSEDIGYLLEDYYINDKSNYGNVYPEDPEDEEQNIEYQELPKEVK